MSERITKLNKLFKEHLGEIFQRELSLKPGVFLTIAKVDTTRDLRYTRVSISVFPFKESDYAIKTIGKEIYSIQGALNKKLNMRPLPRLQFILDSTEEEADKIEKILLDI
ncbi:MAG: ribosome-binding factor A [Candidatus Moranbacteria bacterium]|nr:ribosome-binding factor A [Candidatus Moranbacteria bacterium]